MNTVAKIFFECDQPDQHTLLQDELFEIAEEKNWNIGGSFSLEYLEELKLIAKQMAEKNNTVAEVVIYGTLKSGRFDSKNIVNQYFL